MASASPAAVRVNNREGAAWMLASVAGATGMTVAVRLLTPDIHSAMLAFMRAVFAGLTALPMLMAMKRHGKPLPFTARRLHLLRGVLIAIALNAGFYALWQLPLATATILFFTAPVFTVVLARPVLGETVGRLRWTAVAVGFAGALLILRPGRGVDPAMLVALVSSLAFALALLIGKPAAQADGNEAVFVSSSIVVCFVTFPPALFVWSVPGPGWLWVWLALLFAASTLRQYADIRAYSAGEAGFLAPFSYLRLLTVGALGYLLFGETVDEWTVVGGTVIVIATLVIVMRERRAAGAGP